MTPMAPAVGREKVPKSNMIFSPLQTISISVCYACHRLDTHLMSKDIRIDIQLLWILVSGMPLDHGVGAVLLIESPIHSSNVVPFKMRTSISQKNIMMDLKKYINNSFCYLCSILSSMDHQHALDGLMGNIYWILILGVVPPLTCLTRDLLHLRVRFYSWNQQSNLVSHAPQ